MTKLLNIFKKNVTLEDRIWGIQKGNKEDRNSLIQEYIPFIKKVVSNQMGQYIEIENDDAFSIGLMAFNEAIDKYDGKRGNFLTFASIVIKSRLIDKFRSGMKRGEEVNIDELKTDNIISIESFEKRIETRQDIRILVQSMKEYDVSLEDLIKESPKHKDTRDIAIKIGKYVFENPGLKEQFLKTKNLPTGDLIKELGVSKKVIQRSRKFIIAIILLLHSDLDTLKEYINYNEGREYHGLQRQYNRDLS